MGFNESGDEFFAINSDYELLDHNLTEQRLMNISKDSTCSSFGITFLILFVPRFFLYSLRRISSTDLSWMNNLIKALMEGSHIFILQTWYLCVQIQER